MAKKPKPAIDAVLARRLLDAVLANPADDEPRRVYADALIEAGDPRGEFIAVQLALAANGDRTERQDPSTKPLWAKFRELHSRHSRKWTDRLRVFGDDVRWWWHRGFLRALEAHAWEHDGDTLLAEVLAIEPVVELATGGSLDALTRQLGVAGLERVERLAIHGKDSAAAAASASRLVNVRELRLAAYMGNDGVAALATPTALGRVTHLALGTPLVSADTLATLAASPLGQRLEILEWLRDEITPAHANIIVALPNLHTVVYSYGVTDQSCAILAKRFGDRCIEERGAETERGFACLFEGIPGVSYRRLPSP